MEEKDLKILAFKERISELTTDYEEKVAELRVALTILQRNLDEAQMTIDSMAASNSAASVNDEVVEGEVVEPVQED